jgi:hypothetical protein
METNKLGNIINIDSVQGIVADLILEVYKIEDKINELDLKDISNIERAIRAMQELNYALGLISSIKL